jgi:hypothetical protein
VECANGQTGYGRKRREIKSETDTNKVFEINLTTFIKVEYDEKTDKNVREALEEKIEQLKLANQKLPRNSRSQHVFESVQASENSDGVAKVEETILFTKEIVENSESILGASLIVLITSLLSTIIRTRNL